jgi:type II secretory pathway pseudopilin PulG
VANRNSQGFTSLELAIVLTLFVLVMSVAIPNYMGLMRNVRAAQAVADMQAVRAAAYMYFGDHERWPAEEASGVVPDALRPYLSRNTLFVNSVYRIDWENWTVVDDAHTKGKAKHRPRSKYPNTGVMVGISVLTPDRELMRSAQGLLSSARTVATAADRVTLVIAAEDGF